MEDFDLEVLKANGYNFTGGGIVNAEGKYMPSVKLNGKDYSSTSSEGEWKQLSAINKSSVGMLTPEGKFKKFEKNPNTTPLTEDDKNIYPLYKAQLEAEGKPVYEDVNDYEEQVEREKANPFITTMREYKKNGASITDEMINSLKVNQAILDDMETKDRPLAKKVGDVQAANEIISKSSMNGSAQSTTAKAAGILLDIFKALTPEDYGMKGSDEQKKEYKKVLKENRELKAPLVNIVNANLEEKQKAMEKIYKEKSILEQFHPDNDILRYGINEVEAERNRLTAYVNNQKIYDPTNASFAIDALSAGAQGLFDTVAHKARLHQKLVNGEELTENEKLVGESLAEMSDSKNLNIEMNGIYGLTEGTAESMSFLIGGAMGRVATAGATKATGLATTRFLSESFLKMGPKSAKIMGKLAGESINMAGQTILHPSTYDNAINRYYGDINFNKNEDGSVGLITDRITYNSLVKEADLHLASLNTQMANTKDPEERQRLNNNIQKIEDYKDSLGSSEKAPKSAFDSFMYGATETLKENAIENYGGPLASKLANNRVTRAIAKKPWVTKLAENSNVVQASQKLNNVFSTGKDYFNKLTGNQGSKLVGNNLEEMAEEVMTQLVPVWGETDEEAIQRRGELLDSDFYMQVAGQTLLMGGIMQAASSPSRLMGNLKDRNYYKDQRKNFKSMIKDMGNSGLGSTELQDVMLKAGKGKSVQHYTNRITELRNEGKHDEANDMERVKTFNIGKSMVKMGRGDEYVTQMTGLLAKGSLSPESAGVITETIAEIKGLQADMKEHGDLRNKDYVLELKSKERFNKKQVKDVNKEISKLQGEPESQMRDDKIKVLEEAKVNVEKHGARLEKELAHETSPGKKKKLQQEAEVAKDLHKAYEKLLKEKRGDVSIDDVKELKAKIKKRYSVTITPAVFKEASKSLDRTFVRTAIGKKLQELEDAENLARTVADSLSAETEITPTSPITTATQTAVPTVTDPNQEPVINETQDPVDNMSDPIFVDETVLGDPQFDPSNDIDSDIDFGDPNLNADFEYGDQPPLEDVDAAHDARVMANSLPEITMLLDENDLENIESVNKAFEDYGTEPDSDPANDVGYGEGPPETDPALDKKSIYDSDEDDGDFFNQMLLSDERFDTDPFKALTAMIERRHEKLKKENGVNPTFEDFINDLINTGDIGTEDLKNHMRSLAIAWSGKFGANNWTKLYESMFNNAAQWNQAQTGLIPGTNQVVTISPVVESRTEQDKLRNEEENEMNKKAGSFPIAYVGPTEKPTFVSPNKDRTYGTDHKLNYSGVKHEKATEIINGVETLVVVKDLIPQMNENSSVNFKKLVDPNKNNIGDMLDAHIPPLSELGGELVVNRDEYGVEVEGPRITFKQWVMENKPSNMSFEQFSITDEYIGKLPMFYKDADGDVVAYLPEVNWYSVSTVGDRSENTGEIDMNSPSQSLQEDIDENRRQTLQLRKEVIAGTVKQVEITDNLSHPPLQMIPPYDKDEVPVPPALLKDVAPDSTVVWVDENGRLVGLDNKRVRPENILNWGDSEKGFSKKERVIDKVTGKPENKVKNRNRTAYMQHVATHNGVKKYMIFKTLAKNELVQNQAHSEDIETARFITAINNILVFTNSPGGINKNYLKGGNPYNMDYDKAKELAKEIEAITGVDVVSDYTRLIESLVSYKVPSEDSKTISGKLIADKLKEFNSVSGKPSVESGHFQQNTSLGKLNKEMVNIKLVDGIPVVTNVGSYEQHVKSRLGTDVMSYNVGTEAAPIWTPAIQQNIKIKPISTYVETLEEKIEEQKKNEEVKTKVDEVIKVEEQEVQEVKTQLNEEQKEKRRLAMEAATALAKELNINISPIDRQDFMISSEMATIAEIEKSIMITEGLTIAQEETTIAKIFSKLANKANKKETVKSDILSEINAKKEKMEASIESLREFADNPVIQNMVDHFEASLSQANNLAANIDALIAEAEMRAVNTSFITDDNTDDEVEQEEGSFSKAKNQTAQIDKVGTALKRVFAQVSNGETAFLGFEAYTSFKQMYDTVSLALSTDVNLTSDFDDMMAILSKRKDSTSWMEPLIKALQESDEQVKNQFVYNTYKQKVNAKFATLSYKKGAVDSNILDSNANEAKRAVINSWRENFKRSPINDEGKINTVVLQSAIDQWEKWQEAGRENQTDEQYLDFLSKFGIIISGGTLQSLKRGELLVSRNAGMLEKADFEELVNPTSSATNDNRSGFLFTNLAKYAMMNVEKENLEFYENLENHPFKQMSTILEQLANAEVKVNPNYSSTTRYVGGKMVTEVENFTYFYEQVKKLKSSAQDPTKEQKYLQDLKDISFSSDSMILKMLMEDEIFAEQFNHGMVDLMALKEMYKKTPLSNGIDELSSFDYMFTQRAMFQNRNQGSPRVIDGIPFNVRMAHMNTLTNSDKGRMMLLKTGVVDLYRESATAFDINSEGEISFTDKLQDFLFEQLVKPELKRMINFSLEVKKTNIKDYDKGAVRFNLIPGFNLLKNEAGQTIQELIAASALVETNDEFQLKQLKNVLYATIKKEFSGSLGNYLESNILQEASDNTRDLESFNKELESANNKIDTFNNVDYLAQRTGKSVAENMKIAELDFLINSMVTNMNYMQLMAADPALYYKSNADLSQNNIGQENKASNGLAINLGKRMASMIAPGSVLANSNNNEYLQVFLEDVNGMTDNMLDIVGWHYGEEVLSEVADTGLTYREMIEATRTGDRQYINDLADKFSRIAEFIDIESTDAQEYTTTREHLYIMEKQGRISPKILENIRRKLRLQEEYFADQDSKIEDMPKEYALDTVISEENSEFDGFTEMQILLQPIKPVYTGTIIDKANDVNRMMYIKSSSFPLIPQLTSGRKLDVLRKNMEEVEAREGKTVRASYQTANKVGALTKENTIKSFDQPILPNNTLVMNREHFKIQQDVPYKSSKIQQDTVSMGTQIFKLLFGDGIMEMENFKYLGQTVSGKELKDEFHAVFSKMVTNKKEKFLNSLGLDKNTMQPKDPKQALDKLQRLLQREAKSRGFSKQDLKILSLVEDSQGKSNFMLPLWLTGNSNKYEAMLNAMINNKIFKQKIPGNKFVAASEAGMQMQENFKGVNQSRIIHLGDYKGGPLRSARKNADGTVSKAQVLLPSKFKLGGKLVNLFQDYNEATGEGVYLEKGEDGSIRLKADMISPELLAMFAFRIPTSSHGLGSTIEVAGFLPPESGDLIVTPKGFVAQMGQDFDVDSLTVYQYNHIVMSDGEIKMLNEDNRQEFIDDRNSMIDNLEYLYKNENLEVVSQMLEDLGEDGDLNAITSPEDFKAFTDNLRNNIEKDFDTRVLENKFIAIHNAVYTNEAAQKQINKVLSMAVAENQADDIEALSQAGSNTFNILSPKYQMNKMNAGSTGQVAIGIYAKGVTMHSLFQQAASEGKVIRLGRMKEDTEIFKGVQIGNFTSDGIFGRSSALPSSNSIFSSLVRKISTMLDERTNTATDNEKAQILGRTGLNHKDAIAVDNLLSMLGFDLEHKVLYSQAQFNAMTPSQQTNAEVYVEGSPFHREAEIEGKRVMYKEQSVPYLLHSQPIIKEYFDLMNKKDSTVTEFSGNASEEAINELLIKYKAPKGSILENGKIGIKMKSPRGEGSYLQTNQLNNKFTADMLQRQIALGVNADSTRQLEILAMYTDLITQAKSVQTLNQNVDLNNLGKSMWESSTKVKDFRDYFSNPNDNGVLGTEHLIGEFFDGRELEVIASIEIAKANDLDNWKANSDGTFTIAGRVYAPNDLKNIPEGAYVVETMDTSEFKWQMKEPNDEGELTYTGELVIESRVKEEYVSLGEGVYLKPTTNQGIMVGTALSLSESVFSDLFPARNNYINGVMTQILDSSSVNTANSFATIKAKEQIFQEIKKYLTSNKYLGLFNVSGREVRRILFFDSIVNKNTSLSSYVGNIRNKESAEFEKGAKVVKENLFLNHLKYNFGENGKPSTITFNNQESFETNSEAIYASFKELITEDISLPPILRDGVFESYSTRQLAQDLVSYSYASGGIVQGALEFHKYLPVEYLDDMAYPDSKGSMKTASARMRDLNTFNNVESPGEILGKFTRQYFQNNPEQASQDKTFMSVDTKGNKLYFMRNEDSKVNYITMKVPGRSKLKAEKWKLLERQGKHFMEIPILGETGMAEYDFAVNVLMPTMGPNVPAPLNLGDIQLETTQDPNLGKIPVSGSSIREFLKAIIAGEYDNNETNKLIAEHLYQFVSPEKTFEYKEGAFKGLTSTKAGEMFLNLSEMTNNEDLTTTFLHEVVHSVSSDYLARHIDMDGDLMPNAPSEVIGLNNVFVDYKNQLREKDPAKYDRYMAMYAKRKKNQEDALKGIISQDTVNFTEDEYKEFTDKYYAATSIFEFIATTLGNNKEFLQETKSMEYLASGTSLLSKFGHFIKQVLKRLGNQLGIEENTVALQAIENSFAVLEARKAMIIELKAKELPGKPIDPKTIEDIELGQPKGPQIEDYGIDTSGDPEFDKGTPGGETQLMIALKITKNKCE